jgi:hypothetical protein
VKNGGKRLGLGGSERETAGRFTTTHEDVFLFGNPK